MNKMTNGKINASLRAIEYVNSEIILGVGTGSTIDIFIQKLHEANIRPKSCIASSERTKSLLNKLNFNVESFNSCYDIDLYIDGADAVNDDLGLIKGHGGALFREKILAFAARKFICIVDEEKKFKCLENTSVPVEVLPFAQSFIAKTLRTDHGLHSSIKSDFVTDNGNHILNVTFNPNDTLSTANRILNEIVGIVEHGVFLDKCAADLLIIGKESGYEERLPEKLNVSTNRRA